MRQIDKFAIVFYNTSCKYNSVVGVVHLENKERVPHEFSLEQAMEYLSQRREGAISRGYDIAEIHYVRRGVIEEVFKTYSLDWKEISNEKFVKRKLD